MFLHFLHPVDLSMYLSYYTVECDHLHLTMVVTIASLAPSTLSGKWYILNKYLEFIY